MPTRLTKGSRVDGDDFLELIMGIEEDFEVHFASDAFSNCLTVGDAFDVVCAGLPRALTSGGKCPGQMTFYRLRAAVGDRDLRPETPLCEVPGLSYARLRRAFVTDGWIMPARKAALATQGLSLLAALSVTAGLWPVFGPWALLAAVPVLIVVAQWLHAQVFVIGWPSARTCGDLANDVANINTVRLLRRGASFSRRMLWDRFVLSLGDGALGGPVVRESGFY